MAQPSFHHLDKLTQADGLSSNNVTDVAQDGNGYLWIATSYGLNRYDGAEVVKFFAQRNGRSLPDNKIFDLEKIDSFHIAIATHYGLGILNTRDETFKNIIFKSDSAFAPYDNHIKLLSRDKQGNLWAASLTCLYRLDSSFHVQKTFRSGYKYSDLNKYRIGYINKIIPLESGDLLLWSAEGTAVWDHKKDTINSLDVSPSSKWHFLKDVLFTQCFKIESHYLITIHHNRLVVYDERSGKIASAKFRYSAVKPVEWKQTITAAGNGWLIFSLPNKGLMYMRIHDFQNELSISCDTTVYFNNYTFRKWTRDNEGNWWITTDRDGLIKISPRKQLFQIKDIINAATGQPTDFEITHYLPFGRRLIIATYGDGIFEFDSSSGKFLNHKISLNKLYQNIVWNIHAYNKDTLWVGTSAGLFSFSLRNHTFGSLKIPHPKELDNFPIVTSFTDSEGLVWMGIGGGHGVCVYDPSNQRFGLYPNRQGAYPFRYPISIVEDSASNLWFHSDNTHDLVMWNRNTKQFNVVPVRLRNDERNLPTGNIFLDSKGVVWYGIETFGLTAYNTQTGQTESYGIDKGLNTDLIYNITEDPSHHLWLATEQGISTFDPATRQFVNYGVADGMPSGPYSSRFYFDSIYHRMYVGTPGKIVSFSPADFFKKEPPVKVLITRLSVKGVPVPLPQGRTLKLPAAKNDMTIYFTGINLSNGTENRYAYQLDGRNDDWVGIGSQRRISFASLKPGTYNFQIRASRKDGGWSPVTDHLSITIRPPFTSTVWFYILLLTCISASIYAWYRYRLKQVMKLEKIRAGISHDLHDEIGSRLTNISMMSLLAIKQEPNNSKSGKWLERIGEESRAVSQSMREIVWNINPDNDSLDEAFPRMLRYATDMLEAKGIEVNASVSGLQYTQMGMEKRRDLFLIFKEAVQNIIKHAEARHVKISLNLENGFLYLKIADDGKGFDIHALPFRNGIKYMRQRADRHHWDLTIESDKVNTGTEVRLAAKIK